MAAISQTFRNSLLGVLRELTFYCPKSGDGRKLSLEERGMALFLYPAVGFLIGAVSIVFVQLLFRPFPMLFAWVIFAVSTLISNGRHLMQSYDVIRASQLGVNKVERARKLSAREFDLVALVWVISLMLGKFSVLAQLQFLDSSSVFLLVLFVPMYSRFAGGMLSWDGASENASMPMKLGIAVATLFVTALSVSFSVGLGLSLLVFTLAMTLGVRGFALSRFGVLVSPLQGLAIEVVEIGLYLGVLVLVALGVNVFLM